MEYRGLTLTGFGGRLAASTFLVIATYNPSGWSYGHWLFESLPQLTPALAVAGLLLLGGWLFFLSSTFRSLGRIGIVFGVALLATLVWLLSSWGWIDLGNFRAVSWVLLLMAAVLLAVGVSGSHWRRRISGQADVDDVDDR